ncbi:MAG: hypothetical protein M5U31_04940 [Acidimicrobiia bacterium]|nr:hypothetical protein [Acidimicrobiia bacterium]
MLPPAATWLWTRSASADILTRLGAGDIDLTGALVELRAIEQPAPLGGRGRSRRFQQNRIAAKARRGSLDREVDDALAIVAGRRDLDDRVDDALRDRGTASDVISIGVMRGLPSPADDGSS